MPKQQQPDETAVVEEQPTKPTTEPTSATGAEPAGDDVVVLVHPDSKQEIEATGGLIDVFRSQGWVSKDGTDVHHLDEPVTLDKPEDADQTEPTGDSDTAPASK